MAVIRVLVVDDNKRIVSILKEALDRENDMEVVGTAADGEEALHLISVLRPDVVLLDLIMPKIDGLGVMERMKGREMEGRPEIIVVSAVSQEKVTENAFQLGAAYYVLKPFDPRGKRSSPPDRTSHPQTESAPRRPDERTACGWSGGDRPRSASRRFR